MTYDEIVALKHEVRTRDGFQCVECGESNDSHIATHGKSLEVHRIVPGSEYSLAEGVCVTLCRPCHWTKPRLPRGSLAKSTGLMVRIPEPMAVALEAIADEQYNKLTDQVKIAVREYLERLGRLPLPKKPKP